MLRLVPNVKGKKFKKAYRECSAHITLAVNLITKLDDENSKDFVFCCFFKAQPFCLLCCHLMLCECIACIHTARLTPPDFLSGKMQLSPLAVKLQ